MANETILRKGLIAKAASTVEANLTVEGTLSAEALAVINSSGVTQYTLPTSDGTTGQIIVTDGSGNLSFQAAPSGVVLLSALNDTSISGVASGDFLRYNGAAWVNTTIADGDIAESAVTQHQSALSITESQISNFGTYQATSEKGQANGYASLDGSGLVPSSQLPSYVDDVLEYANEASFPATGETGKLYVDLSDNSVHRWSGSAYINITDYSTPGHTHVAADITDFDTEVDNQIAAADIGDLNNVTITAVANDEILQYTGSGWENQTLAEAGIAATGHTHVASDITDFSTQVNTLVTATDIQDLNNVTNIGTNGQVLQSNGTNATFVTLDHDDISDFDTAAAGVADTQIAAANIQDLNNVSGVGTSGQVLVSDGTGFAPATLTTFVSDSDSIATDSATALFGLTAVDSYAAATVHYSLKDSSGNMRMGQLMVIGNGSSAELTDISTNSLGSDTDEPIFTAAYNGASLEVRITDGSGYTVKTKYIQVNA